MIRLDRDEYYRGLYDDVLCSLMNVNNDSFMNGSDVYDRWLCNYLIRMKSYICVKGYIYIYYEFEYNLLFRYEECGDVNDEYNIYSYDRDKNRILTRCEYDNLMYNMTASGPVSTVSKGGSFAKMMDSSQKVPVSG